MLIFASTHVFVAGPEFWPVASVETVNVWPIPKSTTAFAVLRSQGKLGWWYWVWMFFNLRRIASGLGSSAVQFPAGSGTELFIVLMLGVIIVLLGMQVDKDNSELRNRLIENMRGPG